MTARASTLTTSRLLSGRPVYTSGRLLRDVTTTGGSHSWTTPIRLRIEKKVVTA